MKKIITLVFMQLICFSSSIWACSSKEQLHVVFTAENNNVSHAQIRSLGKWLFSNELLTEELHTFTIDTNHAKGTMMFDVNDQKQGKILLEKINGYLKQNDLKLVRASQEKMLEKQ
jgi:hypothetical protein